MSRLLSLYPRTWRDRYEDEFRSLMADRPPSRRERVDILRGAIDARLHPQVPGVDRVADRFGLVTLAGLGVYLAALLVAANGPVHFDQYGSYRDGTAGIPLMLLATFILALSTYRLVRRLPADAVAGQTAGWLAIVIAPLWPAMMWVLPLGVVLLASLMILAAAAYRARIWPAWLAAALGGVIAIPLVFVGVLMFLPWYTGRQLDIDGLVLIAPTAAIWLLLGLGLLRGFPVSAPAPSREIVGGA